MPMHPAAPEDLHGLVEAYAQTTRAVVDLGHSCSEADFTLQTECPGWTVHDQIAHVAGVESMLEGHRDPEVEVPDYDHLGNELSHLDRAGGRGAPQPAAARTSSPSWSTSSVSGCPACAARA